MCAGWRRGFRARPWGGYRGLGVVVPGAFWVARGHPYVSGARCGTRWLVVRGVLGPALGGVGEVGRGWWPGRCGWREATRTWMGAVAAHGGWWCVGCVRRPCVVSVRLGVVGGRGVWVARGHPYVGVSGGGNTVVGGGWCPGRLGGARPPPRGWARCGTRWSVVRGVCARWPWGGYRGLGVVGGRRVWVARGPPYGGWAW